jgi:hypothetical protein
MTEIQIIMTSDLIAVFQSWISLSYVAISQQPEHMYHTRYSRVGFSYLNIGYQQAPQTGYSYISEYLMVALINWLIYMEEVSTSQMTEDLFQLS